MNKKGKDGGSGELLHDFFQVKIIILCVAVQHHIVAATASSSNIE